MFAGELLGYGACQVFAADASDPAAWAAAGAVAVMTGGIGALVLDWLVLDPQRRMRAEFEELQARAALFETLEHALAERDDWQRRLRHDLRGVLSPALLTADRLLTNEDPKVKRAGTMMVQAVERATALIAGRGE